MTRREKLITLFFVVANTSAPLCASVLATGTFDFKESSGVVEATVTSTVLDNYRGDTNFEDFTYTVTNLSYSARLPPTPAYPAGQPIGLMQIGQFPYADARVAGFLQQPAYPNPYILDNISGPWYFCRGQCDHPYSWSTFMGPGLVAGQSTTFEFSVIAPPGWAISIKEQSAFMSGVYYESDAGALLTGTIFVPHLAPVPEPGTMLSALSAIGCMILFCVRRTS